MNIVSNEKDPSQIHSKIISAPHEMEYRVMLEKYIGESIGSNVDKMCAFTKFVPRQFLAKFLARYELFKQVIDVQGSIIECGVFLGGGLMSWAQLSAIFEPVNHTRKIVGFDTFSGFEKLSEEDNGGIPQFSREGGFAIDSYEDIKRCIDLYDKNRFVGHIEKVKLIKGKAEDTIPKYLDANPHTVISLLYLDFDVYSPTKIAIESFLPRMPRGAIIAFDELNNSFWPGETLAVIESIGIKNIRIKRFPFDSLPSYAVIE